MKQWIERNPIVLGSVGIVLIVLGTVASLTLNRENIAGGYSLTAEFVDAGGLRSGDVVLVAGVRAGRVTDVEIVEDLVEATMQIDGGVELSTTTRAAVVLRTLVGKRAIELQTGEDFSALLEAGDTIPVERTSVAIDVPTFGDTADELLSEIDSEALNQFLRSLTELTRGQREEVAELVENGTRLTDVVVDQEQEIRTLLRELASVSRTLNTRDEEIVRLIDDLDESMGTLAARRPELQRLLQATASTSGTLADLTSATRDDLDAVLDELHIDLALVARHQLDLAEALAYAGDSLVGFSSTSFAGEVPVPWSHVFVTSLGAIGVDLIAACGGLVDDQLDLLLGPDPRSCTEQGNNSFPEDTNPSGDPNPPLIPGLEGLDEVLPGGAGGLPVPDIPLIDDPLRVAEPRLGLDDATRAMLDRTGVGVEEAP